MGGSGLLAVLLMDIFFHRCFTSMFSYVQVIHSEEEEEEEQEMRRSQEPGEN